MKLTKKNKMKTLSNFNLKNKVVLLRADLNSDFVNGKILMSERIKASSETIKLLKRKKARVVVIAHQGTSGKKDCISLKTHSNLLNKFTRIKFVPDLFGKTAKVAIDNLKTGEAILLENLRIYKEEEEGDKKNKLITNLSNWCDLYVNDAFSVCHRRHASIIGLPKYMDSCAGPLVVKELNALKKLHLSNPLYILGGAKPADDLKLLGKNKSLVCGLFGQMCLISQGKNLGAQTKYLKKTIKDYDKILPKLKNKLNYSILPVDFGVKVNGKRKDLDLTDFPSKYEIFDIGQKTLKLFLDEIKNAKAIYMKGPVGDFASSGFEKGTFEILKSIAKSKAFSLIGGGHLSDAIVESRIPKKSFDYISLSGGALLNFVAGEKLPGIEALK
jgi:phosphoglycerate kinase